MVDIGTGDIFSGAGLCLFCLKSFIIQENCSVFPPNLKSAREIGFLQTWGWGREGDETFPQTPWHIYLWCWKVSFIFSLTFLVEIRNIGQLMNNLSSIHVVALHHVIFTFSNGKSHQNCEYEVDNSRHIANENFVFFQNLFTVFSVVSTWIRNVAHYEKFLSFVCCNDTILIL